MLSGPDLTNQLVGVLTRFRQEQIAFIGDIEAMFYQVYVADEHRSLLRFLWWKDGNLNEKPVDYEMCRHVFGGVSSPSCSNYALKKTAVENVDKFGSEAMNTLLKNFYVDDMLKSVPSKEEAILLISKIRQMCAAGGFRLTKFVSNSDEVLQSIPESERKKVVGDNELLEAVTPVHD